MSVRIPADVDREDRLVANLSARQLLVLTAAGLLLYAAWAATRTLVPLPVFAVAAAPLGVGAVLLALGQRDGISLDRLVFAAARWHTTPRHQACIPGGIHPAPAWLAAHATGQGGPARQPAPLHLPARDVTDTGVVDLGADGLVVLALCSTVNFALRTPAEQDALVAVFGRYLHSLTAPVQILVRAERLDLTGQVHDLHARAAHLPHPALAQAAHDHADYLGQLAAGTDLLRRQVLLVLREPPAHDQPAGGGPSRPARRRASRAHHPGDAASRAAETRLARRLAEAADLLAPAGITVTPLGAGSATAVLAAACNPASLVPPSAAFAAPGDVITTATADNDDGQPAAPTRPASHAPTPAGPAKPGSNPAPIPGRDGGDTDPTNPAGWAPTTPPPDPAAPTGGWVPTTSGWADSQAAQGWDDDEEEEPR